MGSNDKLTVTITEPGGDKQTFDCEDVFFINEKSYGFPARLLDEGDDDLPGTLFVNPGAVLTVEIK